MIFCSSGLTNKKEKIKIHPKTKFLHFFQVDGTKNENQLKFMAIILRIFYLISYLKIKTAIVLHDTDWKAIKPSKVCYEKMFKNIHKNTKIFDKYLAKKNQVKILKPYTYKNIFFGVNGL